MSQEKGSETKLPCNGRFTSFIKIHTQLSNGDCGGLRAPLSFQTNQFSVMVLLPASAVPKCLFGDMLLHAEISFIFCSFSEIKLPTALAIFPSFSVSSYYPPLSINIEYFV